MTLDVATQNQEALKLTGQIAANPGLAQPLLRILDLEGGDVTKLESLDLTTLKGAQESLPKAELSTEERLRAENRIQSDLVILNKLGFKGFLPKIPAELIEECARSSGTVVLKFKTTVLDYQARLNEALGSDKKHLRLSIEDSAKTLATTNEEPTWINVPNTVKNDTLGLSKAKALKHIPDSQTCDPMDTVLMLGYNNLQAGQQMPGFTNKWTFTNQKNTLVGSDAGGIGVEVHGGYDVNGYSDVGLAPRLAPESKKA
jgi:hypothetical protein